MLQVVHHLFRDTKTVEEKKLFFKLFLSKFLFGEKLVKKIRQKT